MQTGTIKDDSPSLAPTFTIAFQEPEQSEGVEMKTLIAGGGAGGFRGRLGEARNKPHRVAAVPRARRGGKSRTGRSPPSNLARTKM